MRCFRFFRGTIQSANISPSQHHPTRRDLMATSRRGFTEDRRLATARYWSVKKASQHGPSLNAIRTHASWLPMIAFVTAFASAKGRTDASGFRWAEGPVWFGDMRMLLWSDIPNNATAALMKSAEKPASFATRPIIAMVTPATDRGANQRCGARHPPHYAYRNTMAQLPYWPIATRSSPHSSKRYRCEVRRHRSLTSAIW